MQNCYPGLDSSAKLRTISMSTYTFQSIKKFNFIYDNDIYIFNFRLFFNKLTSNFTEPLYIVLPQMDPIKDAILARRMIILLGGPMIVLAYTSLFSSCVSKRFQQIWVKHPWMEFFLFCFRLSFF